MRQVTKRNVAIVLAAIGGGACFATAGVLFYGPTVGVIVGIVGGGLGGVMLRDSWK